MFKTTLATYFDNTENTSPEKNCERKSMAEEKDDTDYSASCEEEQRRIVGDHTDNVLHGVKYECRENNTIEDMSVDPPKNMPEPIISEETSSNVSVDPKVAVFLEEASQKGLSPETIQVMLSDDFDSHAALKVLDLEQDLPQMDMSTAQRAILSRWVEELSSLSLRGSGDFSISSLMKSVEIKEVKINPKACRKNLHKPTELIEETIDVILKKGLQDFKSILDEKLEEFLQLDVNICVVGDASVGKSSFINTLVHKMSHSKRKACSFKLKAEMQPYTCSHIPRTIIWDYPTKSGRDTKKLKDSFIHLFDAMIICSCQRFSETDFALAKLATEQDISVFYVRTKVDLDVSNEKRDRESDFNEEQLLHDIKNDIKTNLQKANAEDAKVFTVSSMKQYRTQWEFPKLKQELVRNTPKKNVNRFLHTLLKATKNVTRKLVERRKAHVQKAALTIVKGPKSNDVLKQQIEEYKRLLCIDGSIDHHDEPNFNFPEVKTSTKYRNRGVWFFGIGFFIGWIIDAIITHNRREAVIAKTQRDCEKFLKKTLDSLHKEAVDIVHSEIEQVCDHKNEIID